MFSRGQTRSSQQSTYSCQVPHNQLYQQESRMTRRGRTFFSTLATRGSLLLTSATPVSPNSPPDVILIFLFLLCIYSPSSQGLYFQTYIIIMMEGWSSAWMRSSGSGRRRRGRRRWRSPWCSTGSPRPEVEYYGDTSRDYLNAFLTRGGGEMISFLISIYYRFSSCQTCWGYNECDYTIT